MAVKTKTSAGKPTIEQLNREGQCRFASIQSISESDRTIQLSFSSQVAEVPRWFGLEVLDHSNQAVRLDRISKGGALLINHDRNDQVGVVERVWIDNGKGQALVRFGKSDRANEIFQDVKDGIRQNVSVSYFIHDMQLSETRSNGEDVYLITDWEPSEISIVSVPADINVGVGRSRKSEIAPVADKHDSLTISASPSTQKERKTMDDDEQPKHERRGVETPVSTQQSTTATIERPSDRSVGASSSPITTGASAQDERDRAKTILEMGRQYGDIELATTFVSEGRSVSEFQRALLDKINQKGNKPLKDSDSAEIGLSDRDIKQFSFVKAIRSLLNPGDTTLRETAGFEYECSRAAAKKMGRDAQGILVPYDVLSRAVNTATNGNNPGNTGGNLIATTLLASSFIDILRNRTVIMQLSMTMGGLVGNVDIPKQITTGQGYWLGEDANTTETGPEFGQIGMSPKTVGGFTEVTRKLLQQSTPDIESFVRMDLAKALATTIDKAAFYGSGVGDEPLGILNTNGISVETFAIANSPAFAEIVEMESKIASDNADVNSMAYVTNALMRGYFKTTQKFTNVSGTIWEPGNTVNGYRTEITNQINTGDILLGNFSDLIIGMWGGLDLTVDPYSNSKKGRLRIVMFQDVDFAIRHPESFCLGRFV